MNFSIDRTINLFNKKVGELDSLIKRKDDLESSISKQQKRIKYIEEAKEIIKAVGHATQIQIKDYFEDICSTAMNLVFEEEAYEIDLQFVSRRDTTECDIMFTRDGNEFVPEDGAGFGAINVACLALRVTCWALDAPRPHNTLILDEPFRDLSSEYMINASKMLKHLSKELGIQFIIVTHKQELKEEADKSFHVTKRNNKSKVRSS